MSFEAREQRKLRKMLWRNVILANKQKKPLSAPTTKREIMKSFIQSVAKPNILNKQILKRLGVTFLTKEQFRKLIEHGEVEPYDFNEETT